MCSWIYQRLGKLSYLYFFSNIISLQGDYDAPRFHFLYSNKNSDSLGGNYSVVHYLLLYFKFWDAPKGPNLPYYLINRVIIHEFLLFSRAVVRKWTHQTKVEFELGMLVLVWALIILTLSAHPRHRIFNSITQNLHSYILRRISNRKSFTKFI